MNIAMTVLQNDKQTNRMTFDRSESLKSQLQSLGFALRYFNLESDTERMAVLMRRLELRYKTDNELDNDCVQFLNEHAGTMKRFDAETL